MYESRRMRGIVGLNRGMKKLGRWLKGRWSVFWCGGGIEKNDRGGARSKEESELRREWKYS